MKVKCSSADAHDNIAKHVAGIRQVRKQNINLQGGGHLRYIAEFPLENLLSQRPSQEEEFVRTVVYGG